MPSSFFKARADTLPGKAKQWQIFGTSIVTFETDMTDVAKIEKDIASEKLP